MTGPTNRSTGPPGRRAALAPAEGQHATALLTTNNVTAFDQPDASDPAAYRHARTAELLARIPRIRALARQRAAEEPWWWSR